MLWQAEPTAVPPTGLPTPEPLPPNRTPEPTPEPLPPSNRGPVLTPIPETHLANRPNPFEILNQTEDLSIVMRRSKLLRSSLDITRSAVVDPNICDVVQFSLREVSIIGKTEGATDVTFWFSDPAVPPHTYLVHVKRDPEASTRREERVGKLEETIAKLFPNSKVKLIIAEDRLLVTGQARDPEEAAQIMSFLRGESVDAQGRRVTGQGNNWQKPVVSGTQSTGANQGGLGEIVSNVVNMLRIPGVRQVALRVKIAELNRSAAREFGVDLNMTFQFKSGSIVLQSLLNAGKGQSIMGHFDNNLLNFGIHYLEQAGVIRLLSEPTLVTLSGRPASFIAGGEFAVPTIVGVSGASAVSTDFRAFGAILTFTPTVLDKDRIRLEVSPEFSQVNQGLAVNGTPGLNTRSVTTTVEMREGQTLAIAGLLDESMNSTTEGDVPFLAKVFGTRAVNRQETELIILVTPELVHPMEPEEVPPLPGFDVTEPDNIEFFLKGDIEGNPTQEYRSTVWPRLQQRYKAGGSPMISGPFGHSS
ncbi:MAG: pilus assembly protein N-terminal domain-containing protein [Thermoguttaceae bacterium]